MKKVIDYLAWPVACGLIIALCFLIFSKQLSPLLKPALANVTNNLPGTGPVSYADAVKRTAPAVVNIFTQRRVPNQTNPLVNDPLFRHFYNNRGIIIVVARQHFEISALRNSKISEPQTLNSLCGGDFKAAARPAISVNPIVFLRWQKTAQPRR